jgi:predicted nucleic acid-binding protein
LTTLLADTSILIKWFQADREEEVEAARALLAAHSGDQITVTMLDLALYEFGNALLRRFRLAAADVSAQLADLVTIVGSPITHAAHWFDRAAVLGQEYDLTFYDAVWAAAAERLDICLVSADRQLLTAGLAKSATQTAGELGLLQ